MVTAFDAPPDLLIQRTAERLKGEEKVQPPEWAAFVRTGRHREKSPVQSDWWYTRAAAVLRKVYVHGPIGTERLGAAYGGKADRGSAPYHPVKGSRKVVRTILQQLEDAGYLAKADRKGRVVTPTGRSFLDNLAHDVVRELAVEEPERFAKLVTGGK